MNYKLRAARCSCDENIISFTDKLYISLLQVTSHVTVVWSCNLTLKYKLGLSYDDDKAQEFGA